MGDLRSNYRYLTPLLVDAGFRVVTTDLRGHGESDATFADYGDEATAQDISNLIRELGTKASVVGNSMAAGSAVIAAAENPELVDRLVLIGPFVRESASISTFEKLLFRVLMARPWISAAWRAYLPKLYAGTRPDDFEEHLTNIAASLKRPGYAQAFSKTSRTRHTTAEQSLAALKVETLIVMGELDPDFPDPRAEAEWIGAATKGTSVMIPDSGHYPQAQQPERVAKAMLTFLEHHA